MREGGTTFGARVPPAGGSRRRFAGVLVGLVIVLLVFAAFGQVKDNRFVSFDDRDYVATNNTVLRGLTLEGLTWAFSTTTLANWHPLTWLSHMLDVELFGTWAGGHHLMSVFLHAVASGLLFMVLRGMTGAFWSSAFAAAIFALHPLRVESVAWVAERKDVLAALFWILTMACYLRWVRRRGTWRYLLVVGSYALGLMCKSMLVTLPFALLLLDWWPLGRAGIPRAASREGARGTVAAWTPLAFEKLPLLVMAAAVAVVTWWAQSREGLIVGWIDLPFWTRFQNAVATYARYLGKTFRPVGLAVIYPFADDADLWREFQVAVILLVVITGLALWQARRRPWLATGWLWYGGTLVPVIGLVQVGGQSMADRYTYLPSIGLYVMIAWLAAEAAGRWRFGRWAAALAGILMILACMAATTAQVRHWRNSVDLFGHAVQVTSPPWLARMLLGEAFLDEGRVDDAIAQLREAIRIRPFFSEAYNILGLALAKKGDPGGAMASQLESVRIKPSDASAWLNLGVTQARQGRYEESLESFNRALTVKPRTAAAHHNRGLSLANLGWLKEAIVSYREAVRLKPDYEEAYNNLGTALAATGRLAEAVTAFRRAVLLRPDDASANLNLSRALDQMGQVEEADTWRRKAMQLGAGSGRQ